MTKFQSQYIAWVSFVLIYISYPLMNENHFNSLNWLKVTTAEKHLDIIMYSYLGGLQTCSSMCNKIPAQILPVSRNSQRPPRHQGPSSYLRCQCRCSLTNVQWKPRQGWGRAGGSNGLHIQFILNVIDSRPAVDYCGRVLKGNKKSILLK